jgi:hypothetical protein
MRFQSYSPEKNATGVAITAPVYFEIRNDEDVIDVNTVNVQINAVNAIVNGVFQAGYAGKIITVIRGYDVYISHNTLFTVGSTITVSATVNTIFNDQWSFTVISPDTITPVTVANPRTGVFESAQTVSIFVNKPATTHYTIDGSLPSLLSPVYTVPILINSSTTLKFFSIDGIGNREYTHVEIYTITVPSVDPTLPVTTPSVVGGNYDTLTSVDLTTNRPATIYWTIDGSEPTTLNYVGKDSSPVTVALSEGQTVLRFFAIDLAGHVEAVKNQTYVIARKETNIVPTNVFASFPYIKNTVDISWDDMMPIESSIVGYNIYRSPIDAQYLMDIISHDIITTDFTYSKVDNTFEKINVSPVTSTFYRDSTINRVVISEDVSDQFRLKTPIDLATDFAGQIVNDQYWEAIDPDRLFNQSDGIYFTDVYGGRKESVLQSKVKLSGNFDIETAYDLTLVWPVTDTILDEEIAFIVMVDQFTYVKISRIRREAYDYYVGSMVVQSQEVHHDEVATMQLTGKLKISRFGSDVTISYYDGSNWVLLASYLGFSDKDLRVKFYARSADKPINVEFLYLHINSGQAYLSLIKDVRGDYTIQVRHYPIVSNSNSSEYTNLPADVEVRIDNAIALVKAVDGSLGTITLNSEKVYDEVLRQWIEPPKPTLGSIVVVTYKYWVKALRLNLNRVPYYKVTAILSDGSETRLSWCPSITMEADKLDYMYREAIHRNSWLLDQAGERVLLYIRKTTGARCQCYLQNMKTHKQAKIPCEDCWGTGYIGGYDGPYEMRIAPFQSEQKIMMTDRGMKFDNVEETWTTITPVISQRDFIVRRKGQIYAIGPIRTPDIRGVPTQQHFSVEHVDSTDIRYKFVQSRNLFSYETKVGLRLPFAHYTEDRIMTDGEVTENDRLRTDKSKGTDNPKGRTITFENTLY